MTSDQFAQYAKGFSDMPSQVLQKRCNAAKRKRLHIRPSLATPLPEVDSSELVATSFDLE